MSGGCDPTDGSSEEDQMKLLLAIDNSEYSVEAIKEVAKRPWPPKAIVRVISVVEPVTPPATEL